MKKTKSKLREVYESKPFHERERFDDGGSATTGSSDQSLINLITNPDTSYLPDSPNSYAPVPLQSGSTLSADDQAALNAYGASGPGAPTDVGPGPQINNGTMDVDPGSVPTVNSGTGSSSGGSSVSSQTAGALGKLLGLSGSSNSTGMQALQALIGLAGVGANYANNKANTPTFAPPALFGGQAGTTGANGSSGGYGPPGGYNFQNYKGATASTPGLGYAPRTAVTPNIPNYYTYGQGPQASFFTGSAPAAPAAPSAPAAPQSSTGGNPSGPTTMKRGGLMRKYAVGGRARHFIGGTPAPVSAPNAAPIIGTPTGVGSSGLLAGLGAMGGTAPPALGGAGTGALLQGVQGPAFTTAQQQFLAGNGPGAMNPANNPFSANSGAPSGVGALSPQVGAQLQPKPPAMSNALPIPGVAGQNGQSIAGGLLSQLNRPQPSSGLTAHQPTASPQPVTNAPALQRGPVQRPLVGMQRPMMRASGGSTVDAPGNGPMASSHVIQESGVSPLSQMYQSRRQWQGPSSQNIGMPQAQGHASGGREGPLSQVSRHVVGPGDGTSDDIPARLANGEYVMDAQTVSMLGNGSNDAGAKKLDAWRQNIRKQKGKALAKGEMAPDAHKNLNRYMK
jgi:hypothetical protein